MSQYSVIVTKHTNGAYVINDQIDWQGIFPFIAEFYIKEFETSKKKPSRVLLLGRTNQIEIIIPNEFNIQDVLAAILFKGNLTAFAESNYFQEIEKRRLPILFMDKLSVIPFETQRKLMQEADYALDAYPAAYS